MRRAALQGHAVLFVETGEFLGRHLLRLVSGPNRSSLARRLFRGERVAAGITVRKALNALPWGQRFAFSNGVNGLLTLLVLGRAARSLCAPRVTWLYDPRTTWAIRRLGDSFGVYDCVDDYAEQAAGGRNKALLAAADRKAAATARIVFTTTRALLDRHRRTNANTHLVPNAADYEHFAPAADRARAARELADLPRPVLGFAGNITRTKIDLRLVAALADTDPARTILLTGPADPALAEELAELTRRTNVVWTGPVPFERLPGVVAAFDVGLIPYVENNYTRNVFPLKLYEYLAAGKPVVATGLPELFGLEPDAVVARGVQEVEDAVAHALVSTAADVRRRQEIARANTWEVRTGRLLSLVEAQLAG